MLMLIVGLAFVIAWGSVTPWWIFLPLKRAARARRLPTQWSLGDLLCFFVLAALPAAVLSFAVRESNAHVSMLVYGSACSTLFVGALWLSGVRDLSQAGIGTPWRRAAFLTLLMPLATISMVALPVSFVGAVVAFRDRNRTSNDAEWLPVALAVGSAALVVALLSGLVTRWLVRGEAAIQDKGGADAHRT